MMFALFKAVLSDGGEHRHDEIGLFGVGGAALLPKPVIGRGVGGVEISSVEQRRTAFSGVGRRRLSRADLCFCWSVA
jgi:hypothetical protein